MVGPLSPERLAALQGFSTPTICNAIERLSVRGRRDGFIDSSIVCRFPELGRTVGFAVTARMRAGQLPKDEVPFEKIVARFAETPRPWIVVVEDLDWPTPVGSYWGEVNAAVYGALGAVGMITNGGVRDLSEVRRTGFQFFSSCVLVSHAWASIVQTNEAVTVGGLLIKPGDLLHGDEHGVAQIPTGNIAEVIEAARQVESGERRLIDYARSPSFDFERLKQMYEEVD